MTERVKHKWKYIDLLCVFSQAMTFSSALRIMGLFTLSHSKLFKLLLNYFSKLDEEQNLIKGTLALFQNAINFTRYQILKKKPIEKRKKKTKE